MRRKHHLERPTNTAAPGPDWILVCRRQITTSDTIYPCGSQIPVKAAGANLEKLLGSGYVVWLPRGRATAYPRPLPKPERAKARPPLQFVADPDPCEAWRLSLEANARVLGNRATAEDLLLAISQGRELYKLQARVLHERQNEARRRAATAHLEAKMAARGAL